MNVDLETFEDRLRDEDFRRWFAVWGDPWDEQEDRWLWRWRKRVSKQSHRPKRGRFTGWRGH